jgi:hypothetical protein
VFIGAALGSGALIVAWRYQPRRVVNEVLGGLGEGERFARVSGSPVPVRYVTRASIESFTFDLAKFFTDQGGYKATQLSLVHYIVNQLKRMIR